MKFKTTFLVGLLLAMATAASAAPQFTIGEKDFLLDGKKLQIRCGEIHFARVPREYWRDRLKRCKAMGLNAVCAYLFWNFHEFEKGKYNWAGQADAAEFCRIAQEEGLWVILRPGPYACAEWDGGGLPWWLLKNPNIRLRSQDPDYMQASVAWLKEVGRVLAPLQVSKGGPILMVQVENEYGSYGNDAEYMGQLRKASIDAGFDVPLFACNPLYHLKNGYRSDLFQVVNFGRDPEVNFKALRTVQPTGPLMCGEFYPGWFDTWGSPHHKGDTRQYLKDLETMLKMGASFSIYMAHGGTSFGLWPGADRPFKPDTSSYDYDAPISEAGWTGEKFQQTRELMAKYLLPGETLPAVPANNPVVSIPEFALTESAPVLDNLPRPIEDGAPGAMETYDQGQGCILYRTTLPAGGAAMLQFEKVGDFGRVFLDGAPLSVLDRRSQMYSVKVPARAATARLDVLVEAMGHVNFGGEIHDRKGVSGAVKVLCDTPTPLGKWQVFPLPLNARMLKSLKWKPNANIQGPAFWRGSFRLAKPADTFFDLRKWGKGVIWINGHCLSRFWNIGPTQTAYVPAPWLRAGRNEVVVLDLLGPTQPRLAGLEQPILDQLRPELDFRRKATAKGELMLGGLQPAFAGTFSAGPEMQEVRFPQSVAGRQFLLETLNAHDEQGFAAIAELDLLDADWKPIPHTNWTIPFVSSEELGSEDGSASNAIDGQSASYWHSQWSQGQFKHPHQFAIDLGTSVRIGGFRYTPRAGNDARRIKDYRVFIGDNLVKVAEK